MAFIVYMRRYPNDLWQSDIYKTEREAEERKRQYLSDRGPAAEAHCENLENFGRPANRPTEGARTAIAVK